jgi:hypothetical protein
MQRNVVGQRLLDAVHVIFRRWVSFASGYRQTSYSVRASRKPVSPSVAEL